MVTTSKISVSQIINNPDKNLLTVAECAAFLNIHTMTCYKYLQKNEIPHVKLGGKRLISKEVILEFIKGGVKQEETEEAGKSEKGGIKN